MSAVNRKAELLPAGWLLARADPEMAAVYAAGFLASLEGRQRPLRPSERALLAELERAGADSAVRVRIPP